MFTITRFPVKMSKKLLVSAFIGGFATIGALAWAAQSVVFVQPTNGTPIPWPLDGSNIPKVDCVTGCGGGGAGTVTEVDTSGGVTGGPITTTGTVTLTNLAATSHQWLDSVVSGSFHKSQPAFTDISGTAAVTQGGTGVTTLGANGVVLGEGSAAVHVTAAGTAGDVLTSNGAGADPTFQAASGGLPSGGVTGQVLNAVTASPPVWGSVVIGPDAAAASGGNGADVTVQSGAADGAGTDGVIRFNAACNNTCQGIVIGDFSNNIYQNTITGDNASTGSNTAGLNISLTGGSGDGTGSGGTTNIFSGAAGANGNGGLINITANNGGATSGTGGSIGIQAGPAMGGDSNGGAVSVTAGNGSGTGTGGNISLTAGAGATNGSVILADTDTFSRTTQVGGIDDGLEGWLIGSSGAVNKVGLTVTPTATNVGGGAIDINGFQGHTPFLAFAQAEGDPTTPTALNASREVGAFNFDIYNGSGFPTAATITVTKGTNPGNTDTGVTLTIETSKDGTTSRQARITIDETGNINIPHGVLSVGTTAGFVGSDGEFGAAKITASGSAPGAGTAKLAWVAGTLAGTCKLIAYAGTSTTPTTVIDNVGGGC